MTLSADTGASQPWWPALYDDAVAELLLVRRDQAELEATLNFLVAQLALKPGQRVLDQCCGIGSLSIPLSAQGVTVVGVDQAAAYIERARRDARAADARCEFHAADARTFVPSAPCHAAFNWWTSFGYCATDAENLRLLTAAHASLVPGGRLALDFPNMAALLHGFQETMVHRGAFAGGEAVCTRRSRVDLVHGLLEQEWTWDLPDGKRTVHNSALRIYLPHALGELLTTAGFSELRFLGGIRGESLQLDSPRVILLARKS